MKLWDFLDAIYKFAEAEGIDDEGIEIVEVVVDDNTHHLGSYGNGTDLLGTMCCTEFVPNLFRRKVVRYWFNPLKWELYCYTRPYLKSLKEDGRTDRLADIRRKTVLVDELN